MSADRAQERTLEWVLHARAATWDQPRRLRECLDARRHASGFEVTISAQLEALNNVEAPASGQLRYCSHCWSVFRSNGEMFTPKSGGA